MNRTNPKVTDDPDCQALCFDSPRELGHPTIKGLDMLSFDCRGWEEQGYAIMNIDCLFVSQGHHEVRWKLTKQSAAQLVTYLTKEFNLEETK